MPKLIDIVKINVKEAFRPPEGHMHEERDDSDAELHTIILHYKNKKKDYNTIDLNDDEYVHFAKGNK